MGKNKTSPFGRVAAAFGLALFAMACQSAPKTVYAFDMRSAKVPVMLGKQSETGGRAIAAEEINRTFINAYDTVNVAQQTVHVVETNIVRSKYNAGEQLSFALKQSDLAILLDEIALDRIFKGDFGAYSFHDSLKIKARALGAAK